MAEGLTGIFKDHENNFSCNTMEEWIGHLANADVSHSGNTLCVTCGTPTDFVWKGKLQGGRLYPNVLCKECKAQ